MKLDDRPVIDQLLNPTPLNILHEVLMAHVDLICNKEVSPQEQDWALESLHEFARDLEARL